LQAKPKAVRLTDSELFDWLRLIRSENVGPRTFRALIANCGSAGAAIRALPDMARRGGAGRAIRIATSQEIEQELTAAHKIGVRFLGLDEPDYPPALRQIDSAPPILTLRGRAEALQQPAVAIVGSRNASAAGLTFAERLARGIGGAGYVVLRAWRAASTSAPISPRWRPGRSRCWRAAMPSPIRRKPRL
jgi:DNA processing protein